jgi:hypothetical protein
MDYVRSDQYGDGKECLTGKKVLCQSSFKQCRPQGGNTNLNLNINSNDNTNIIQSSSASVWVGTAPFCGGRPSDCTDRGMDYVRSDQYGDGKECLTGEKVLCQSPPSGPNINANINSNDNMNVIQGRKLSGNVNINSNTNVNQGSSIDVAPAWGQCGGKHTKSKACEAGYACVAENEWYSSCKPLDAAAFADYDNANINLNINDNTNTNTNTSRCGTSWLDANSNAWAQTCGTSGGCLAEGESCFAPGQTGWTEARVLRGE